MPKKGRVARSMRGVMVDFDLIDIRKQLSSAPKPTEVKAREDFIDRRQRRRQRVSERQQALNKNKNEEIRELTPEEREIANQLEEMHNVDGEQEIKNIIKQEEVEAPEEKPKKKTRRARTIKKKT